MRETKQEYQDRILENGIRKGYKNMADDQTEELRKERIVKLNLEAQYGRLLTTTELTSDYDVLGFMAPYVVCRRLSDGKKGTFEFLHSPRFYFNWRGE